MSDRRVDRGVRDAATGVTAVRGWAGQRETFVPLVGWVAMGLVVVLGLRLHELVGLLAPLRPALVLSVVGLALILTRTPSHVLESVFREPIVRLIVALYAWAIVTIPLAMYRGLAFDQSVMPSFITLTMITGILVSPPSLHMQRLFQWTFAGGMAAHLVLALATGRVFGGRLYVATSGLDPNDYAAMAAMTFPLALGLVQRERGPLKVAAFAAAMVLGLGVIRTASRGGTLAIMAGAAVFILMSSGAKRFLYFGLLAALAWIGWNAASPQYRASMTSLVKGEEDYNYTEYTGRKQIWARARGYIRQNPVFGVGIGNFPIMEGQALADVGRTGKWSTAHNSYYQVAVELGIPGGLIFLAIIVIAVRLGLRLRTSFRREPRGPPQVRPEYVAAVVSYSVSSIFLSHGYSFVFFGLVAFIAFTNRVAIRQRQLDSGAPSGRIPNGAAGSGGVAASARSGARRQAEGWRTHASRLRWARRGAP